MLVKHLVRCPGSVAFMSLAMLHAACADAREPDAAPGDAGRVCDGCAQDVGVSVDARACEAPGCPRDATLDGGPRMPRRTATAATARAGGIPSTTSCGLASCEGGAGPSFTLACRPSDGNCAIYPSTCTEPGYFSCETRYYEEYPGLHDACVRFCESIRGVYEYTGCDFV